MKTKEITAKTLNTGFIGVGWIGKNRMEAMLTSGLARASHICEPFAFNAKSALSHAPEATLVTKSRQIYADPDVDAVVIATPSALHAGDAIAALNAGKAVFCQKPLGRTAEEVKKVVEAARRNDRLLDVDLSYRHTKAFRAIRELIEQQEIGKIYAVDLIFHNAYGPDKEWFYDVMQSGGGCVMDLGIHLIDMVLLCLGFPEIKTIDSRLFFKGKRLISPGIYTEDFASVSMHTDETSIHMQCSWNLPAGKEAVIEARFYGTEGGAAFRNVNGSFYDFVAERYHGTTIETLISPPDNWGGRTGVAWLEKVAEGKGFDEQIGRELIKVAETIDRIYGR